MAYEVVIGLEVHTELSSKSKIFCSCTTLFGGEANSHICEGCTGFPGALPVLNEAVLERAIKTGLATNCEINLQNRFDRKHYFYPDSPTAYQTTQFYQPICLNGYLEVEDEEGQTKKIRIKEIHMEEDAGKLSHDPFTDTSLVDYNRAGVALLEIVSEPDFRSAAEVVSYLEKLRSILQYADISDCKMQEGSLRADINLSIRPKGSQELGVRTEMKNLNSFRAIARAIESETQRQIDALRDGEEIIQETRRWDDDKGESFSMRTKEDALDYRYFPDPDLPPLTISEDMIEKVRKTLPEMPEEKKKRYIEELGLPEYDTGIITDSVHLVRVFEETAKVCADPKEAANWIMGELLMLLKDSQTLPENIDFDPSYLGKIINMLKEGKINRGTAKKVFAEVFAKNMEPEAYIKENNLELLTDNTAIKAAVEKVVAENEKSVNEYKSGKKKAFQFLMGQSMKALRGQAPAQEVSKLLKELLD
ncbi:MAG: Asp-tRNA(Asn)/Glu-tRNA(Gln) amidotransferase subunit GatB [Clostridiales bacterium]|nr:Asp-tRNA(Asn)/Glu-tRNA(Gln) amidotransferase subunit GatB [Clostridiales bacterium]